MPADPHVVSDGDWLGVFDVLPATLDLSLMRGGKDRDVGPNHHSVSKCHEPAVQNRQIEVGVEFLANANVAAIVKMDRRFDIRVIFYVADHVFETFQSLLLQSGVVRREVGIVLVTSSSNIGSSVVELWHQRVVSVFDEYIS